MTTKTIFLLVSYLLGNVLGGKLISYIYSEDLASRGSGNIGARNAGRLLGTGAFVLVALVDILKGFSVVILFKMFAASNTLVATAFLLVILGHIYPALNKFKGGKGVATFVGGLLILSPNIIFVFILGVLLISFITRSVTIGFYSTLPALIFIQAVETKSWMATLVFLLIVAVLMYVARSDIRKSFNKYFMIRRRAL